MKKLSDQFTILNESLSRIAEIEESDDPFCIGATGDEAPQSYTAIGEGDYDHHDDERKEYEINSDQANYQLFFTNEHNKETAFFEIDGIAVASFETGGGGAHTVVIKDQAALMNALADLMMYQGSRK